MSRASARHTGYHTVPYTANRRVVAASVGIAQRQSTIHSVSEIDVSVPRTLLRRHFKRTGEKLSFTAFIVASLARVVDENPEFNSFRKGRKLVLLDDVTISVLVERDIEGESVPEPLAVHAAQAKTYRQIHEEIRAAQRTRRDGLGALSDTTWIRFIPGLLLRMFVRLASRNIGMAKRFGKVAVTAVGMYGSGALWFIPVSGGTVVATVGSIVERPILRGRRVELHEFLCMTLSFNHDIIDGAPAARFVKRLAHLMEHGEVLLGAVDTGAEKIRTGSRSKVRPAERSH